MYIWRYDMTSLLWVPYNYHIIRIPVCTYIYPTGSLISDLPINCDISWFTTYVLRDIKTNCDKCHLVWLNWRIGHAVQMLNDKYLHQRKRHIANRVVMNDKDTSNQVNFNQILHVLMKTSTNLRLLNSLCFYLISVCNTSTQSNRVKLLQKNERIEIHLHHLSKALTVCLNCEVGFSSRTVRHATQFQVKISHDNSHKMSPTLQSQTGRKCDVTVRSSFSRQLL